MKDIVFTGKAYTDFIEWSKTDRKVFEKISILIEETSRTPFKGKGKPEPLRHQLKGCWSRRITEEHRLVYKVNGNDIQIISCKYHYQE
jgi:toxin YoeB